MTKAEVNNPNNLSDGDNTTHRAAISKDELKLIAMMLVFFVCLAMVPNRRSTKEDPSLMAELQSLKLEVQKIASSLNAPSTEIESVSTPSQEWIPNEQQGAISAADCLTPGFNLAPYLTPAHLTYLLCTIPCTTQAHIRFNQTGTFRGRSQDESLEVYEAECTVWRMKECDGVAIPVAAEKEEYRRVDCQCDCQCD
jgi:hypothetical protein